MSGTGDREPAHRLAVEGLKGLAQAGFAGRFALRALSGGSPRRPATVLGMEFSSRVGLAAGFDKDAELVTALPELGFGFAEIGTVTPRPQVGNPRPRLFRSLPEQALFNRMGFNNGGAQAAADRLAHARNSGRVPDTFRVGVNVGKNKDTSAEQAHEDYVAALKPFRGLADYAVINVSSPNTPGLRALQTVEALQPIVQGVLSEVAGWEKAPPVLLKLAPEVQGQALHELVHSVEAWGIAGWVLTNTRAGEWQVGSERLPGGWSGLPVRDASVASLKAVRSISQRPIISVGGILEVKDAAERIELGADLIQIYSGWVLRGPRFPGNLVRGLPSSP